MKIKTQAYFHLIKQGCIPEDKNNYIDLDANETQFDVEHVLKFENAYYISLIMLMIWNKVYARAKKKLSPRSVVARYPPLDPKLANMKDSERMKQVNWTIIVRELRKFEIELNSIVREMLIAGDHDLISKLVHMLVNYDLNKGEMTMSRYLEPDMDEPTIEEYENRRRSPMSSLISAYAANRGRSQASSMIGLRSIKNGERLGGLSSPH